MDFAALPPEFNSGRTYSRPGFGSAVLPQGRAAGSPSRSHRTRMIAATGADTALAAAERLALAAFSGAHAHEM
jgi:PPE-repeat protein